MKPFEEIRKESDETLYNRVWFNLIRAHRNLYPRIEKKLRQHGIDNPVWYEILMEIERAGDAGIRLTQLQQILYMSQFNLSRHVKRIEKKGFITRTTDPEDGRAYLLVLEPKGINMHEEIWPFYVEAIQEELAHRMSRDEAFELFKNLTNLYP